MDPHIGGNAVPEITREEHDHSLSAKRVTVVGGSISSSSTVYIGTPTLYAVVNTGAAGDSTAKIGFATVNIAGSATIYAVVNTAAAGQASVVVSPSSNYIGLVTAVIGNSISQPVTIQPPASGSLSVNMVGIVSTASIQGKVSIVDPTGAEMDLFKENDNFAAGGDHGLMVLSVTDTTPRQYKPLSSNVTALDGESNAKDRLVVEGYDSIYNGSTWDRIRGANAANATTGTGLIGSGILGFDGTNYRLVSVDGNGILKGNVTIANTSFSIVGNVTLSPSINSIGFATVAVSTPTLYAVVNTGAAGQASVVLDDSVNRIGFATVNVAAIAAGSNYIGLASINGSVVNLAGTANIGCVTLLNQPALTASSAFIGIVTVASTVQLRAGAAFVGLMTVVNGAGVANIGFVTVKGGTISANNSGTTKTLIMLPINISTGSVATIAVPATNLSVKITNMLLSADATVVVRMKSGVTYLTGNASLGVSLNPNGGFVLTGSPDSPSWIGLPSGALVIEKNNTTTNISGNVVYFAE